MRVPEDYEVLHHQMKYRVKSKQIIETAWHLPSSVVSDDGLVLLQANRLVIWPGFLWNGANFPALDSPCSQRGSMAHDALCLLLREGKIPFSLYRKLADLLLERLILEDGMTPKRAKAWYWAVRLGAFISPSRFVPISP